MIWTTAMSVECKCFGNWLDSKGRRRAAMPVVFTSVLPHQPQASDPRPMAWLGDVVYRISQTPQVWLDHVVFEEAGALVYNWNAVEELFPEGLLDDMFEAYCRLLQRLADEAESWQESWPETASKLLPPAQLEQRAAVNATGRRHRPDCSTPCLQRRYPSDRCNRRWFLRDGP